MLSATNSLNDIKAELLNKRFYDYRFQTDTLFETAITKAIDTVDRLDIIPFIGQDSYDTIQAKDKVNLTLEEQYMYYAEVNLTLGRFFETLRVNGKNFDSESIEFNGKGKTYLSLAGFQPNQLKRTSGIFSEDIGENVQFPGAAI